MKAVVYKGFGVKPEVREVPDPSPSEEGVVLKVGACGVCRSDWHGWMGNDPDIVLPHVPGHELAGTILETGKNVNQVPRRGPCHGTLCCGVWEMFPV